MYFGKYPKQNRQKKLFGLFAQRKHWIFALFILSQTVRTRIKRKKIRWVDKLLSEWSKATNKASEIRNLLRTFTSLFKKDLSNDYFIIHYTEINGLKNKVVNQMIFNKKTKKRYSKKIKISVRDTEMETRVTQIMPFHFKREGGGTV